MRGLGRIKRLFGRYKSKFVDSALILVYHRVAELPSDPQLLSVTPRHFAEHLDVLCSKTRPIGLQQLTRNLKEGNVPNRVVVITFDDGYADNLVNVKPILERYNVPATVFISSAQAGGEHEFWWDRLERILLQPGLRPATLQLKINGKMDEWELAAGVEYGRQEYLENQSWNVMDKTDPSVRHAIYRSLHQSLRTLSSTEQDWILDELAAWAGIRTGVDEDHLSLKLEQINALIEDGLIDVGAHTITHPSLASLPYNAQEAEIGGSKTELEKIIGKPVLSFAYPYGARIDYSNETVDLVQQAGFTCACTNIPGIVWRSCDPFQVPRILIQDCDREIFERQLGSWWSG